MLRDRIMKALGSEDPERIKLNMDIELEDVVAVTWYPATRAAKIRSEGIETWRAGGSGAPDSETINGVYKILCEDMHQSVRGEAFTAKERTDPKVVFVFFEPRSGGFDESKGTLWID